MGRHLKEIHAANVGSIRQRGDANPGMVLRSRRVLWGPQDTLNRAVELALDTTDIAFIIEQAVQIYGADNVVRAVMKTEAKGIFGPVPAAELEGK